MSSNNLSRHDSDLDEELSETLGDLIEDPKTLDPADLEFVTILRDKIEKLLGVLTYREREIIRLRYGLGDGFIYTLEETGRIFKVTKERIRQIEQKAVKKLQEYTRDRMQRFVDRSDESDA